MWEFLFFLFYGIIISPVSGTIEEIATKYFKSGVIKTCEEDWNKHRTSFENLLTKSIKEGFGGQSMNIYIQRRKDTLVLTKGYYHTDNQIHFVLQDVVLHTYPQMSDPEISFPLCSNALKIETTLRRMILHASYLLFRNRSSIIFNRIDQDPYLNSPFRFEQVRNMGEVAISVDRCILSGVVIPAFKGHSINLQYNSFRLNQCQVYFEIFYPGSGTPPVIANYMFDREGGLKMEQLIMRALNKELIPQLQATMFAHINSTAIFKDKLTEIMDGQSRVLEETETYITNVVGQINSLTKQNEAVQLKDFHLNYNDTFDSNTTTQSLSLTKVYLSGLDSAYSAHIGGPYKLTSTKIAEQIRFSTLQIVGVLDLFAPFEGQYNFAVEINDAAVDLTITLSEHEGDDSQKKFEVVGWRTFEFSCPDVELLPVESIVSGYLTLELPKHLEKHFNNLYSHAVTAHEKDVNDGEKSDLSKEGEQHTLRMEMGKHDGSRSDKNVPKTAKDKTVSTDFKNHDKLKLKRRPSVLAYQPLRKRKARRYDEMPAGLTKEKLLEDTKKYQKEFEAIMKKFDEDKRQGKFDPGPRPKNFDESKLNFQFIKND